jgi:hypothetical protein
MKVWFPEMTPVFLSGSMATDLFVSTQSHSTATENQPLLPREQSGQRMNLTTHFHTMLALNA